MGVHGCLWECRGDYKGYECLWGKGVTMGAMSVYRGSEVSVGAMSAYRWPGVHRCLSVGRQGCL